MFEGVGWAWYFNIALVAAWKMGEGRAKCGRRGDEVVYTSRRKMTHATITAVSVGKDRWDDVEGLQVETSLVIIRCEV